MEFEVFLNKDKPPTFPGALNLNIIGCRALQSSKLDIADPFAEIKISKGDNKIVKTKVIDNNPNPIWSHSDAFELDLSEKDWETLKLYIKVFDYNLV